MEKTVITLYLKFNGRCQLLNARAILVKVATAMSLKFSLVLKLVSLSQKKLFIFPQASAENCLPAASSSLLLTAIGEVTWHLVRPSCL